MILKTKRLILRPWNEEDAESLFEYARDDRVGPIAGWPPHTSVENSRELIKAVLSAYETYAVCLKEDNKAIGSIGLMIGSASNLDLPEDEGEIGYWIGVPFWGQGLMPEAIRELIRHAFADLGIRNLWCGYFDGNEKSKRCQEKCGFAYHHTNRDIHWELMDDIRTEHITHLTKDDWKSSITVRKLAECEIPAALSLAWEVFSEYEAPEYPAEGTEEFRNCLHDESYLAGIEYYGAFDRETLVGMFGIRKENSHICFLFVDGKYHRLGLGTRLFACAKGEYLGKTITLNSSPYGVPFYRALGFTEADGEQTVNGIRFTPMTRKMHNLVMYIHGKGGSTSEFEHYVPLFPHSDVIGFDYKSQTPWEAVTEFSEYYDAVSQGFDSVYLIANSIGAYFSLCSLADKQIKKAYFISPIVDMERLISNMIAWAGVSETELREKQIIPTSFGETLSWEYLKWVRKHPASWKIPTEVLYGERDNMQSFETIDGFAEKSGANVTVMPNGEHWFHTDEQMRFLDNWLKTKLKGNEYERNL